MLLSSNVLVDVDEPLFYFNFSYDGIMEGIVCIAEIL